MSASPDWAWKREGLPRPPAPNLEVVPAVSPEGQPLPTYAPRELRGILEDLGHSEPVIAAQLRGMEAAGRLTEPLVDLREPQRLTLDAVHSPPVERFLLGRMLPLAKSSVLYGPTGAGKSAWLAQLAFAVAGHEPSLHGLAVGVHGPVLVVSAEDSVEDWQRKAAACHYGTDLNIEGALDDLRVLDLTEGEARLSEVVTVRDGETTRRESRATEMRDRIVAHARKMSAVLILVETASRLVPDEDNASFSALQSALGSIARRTGAAVVVTHHVTKAASREGDSSIEAARGGGAFVANARNALALSPADPEVAKRYGDRFAPDDVFTLSHGKSTSSTRREDSIVLIRCGTAHGAVFQRPDDVEVSPERTREMEARRERARAEEVELLRKLYAHFESILPTQPRISPSHLYNERYSHLGITKRRMRALVETAIREGVLKVATRSAGGLVTLALGHDPRRPVNDQKETL
jgi:RecA-family ATPase